ncbi:MAG: hypothetical protein WDO74_34920 [Pseudomonadota bacterium]
MNGAAFVWIAFREGDEVRVAVERKGSTIVPAIDVGQGSEFDFGDYRVAVLNGTLAAVEDSAVSPGKQNALVIIDGSWPEDSDFAIVLEGHGSAQLWVQGQGDLDPNVALVRCSRAAKKKARSTSRPALPD